MDPRWGTDRGLRIIPPFFSRTLLPVALLGFGIPFIGLLFYSSMNADDFAKATISYNCANQPHVRTILGMTRDVYLTETGRWLASLLQGFVMSKFNLITSYGWLLLLVVLTNVGALSYFFANFLRVS